MSPYPAPGPSPTLFNVPACFPSFQTHMPLTPPKKMADAQSHLFKWLCKGGVFGNRMKKRRLGLWSLWGANGLDCLSPCWRGLRWGQCETQGVLSKVVILKGSSQWHISTLSKCWFVRTNIRGALNELTKDPPSGRKCVKWPSSLLHIVRIRLLCSPPMFTRFWVPVVRIPQFTTLFPHLLSGSQFGHMTKL